MHLPKLENLALEGKKVLLRGDLDVDLNLESFRLKVLIPTLKFLSEKNCRLTLIGHRGRPEGRIDQTLSLKPVGEKLRQLAHGISFEVLENLRFDPGEMNNSTEFVKKLAENQNLYVNESFAESHRETGSIVGLPKLLPHAAGLRFVQEVENLSKVFENPRPPVIVIISGIKEDKLSYIEPFLKFADKILVAGRLPEYLEKNSKLEIQNSKLVVANLLPDKEDITIRSIEEFESEIQKARTIVLAGPIGKFENEGHRQGTERIFKAVAANKGAFKVAGGGETIKALETLGLAEGFDWISVGGGAMLEFLSKRTLPGIEALLG